ncbi:MAG TPA: response regulator transcription factor [candidate division Zixibacteria bacterium]|nr:response regulator transcription factor [candidate division Zixibacteria bacterium]
MDQELTRLQNEFARLLDAQEFSETDLDPAIAQRHIDLLTAMDEVETAALSVFDIHRREHIYVSPKYRTVFGWEWDPERPGDSVRNDDRLHPEDRLQLFRSGIYFMSFLLRISPERRRDGKMFADYRMLGPEDKYIRVLEQQSVLELDRRGNVWLALSVLNISPYADTETSFRCRMIDSKTGQLFEWPPREATADLLTMREKEILHLVSKGLVSREIADLLYISVNTVNTHRQRILKKLDVSNTAEAIRYALDIGLTWPEE